MKVILMMTQSVNGFIANINGETPWSQESWEIFTYTVKKYKNFIIGRRTYELMKQGGEIDFIRNPFIVVVSSDNYKDENNVHFVKSPVQALELLGSEGFDTVLVAGGPTLGTSFLQENLIDEIHVDVEPMLFKEGVPFLKYLEKDRIKLKFLGAENYRYVVARLKYEVMRK